MKMTCFDCENKDIVVKLKEIEQLIKQKLFKNYIKYEKMFKYV